jgi:hypothetical protein
VTGLIPKIETAVSVAEHHRTIKVWRALWKRMQAMQYVNSEDPSKAIANSRAAAPWLPVRLVDPLR